MTDDALTRRRFLGAGAAAGLGAAAAAAPADAARHRRRHRSRRPKVDVVVVGAGFAGLTAARDVVAGRQVGVVARGAQPRRRPGVSNHDLGARQALRARRHLRRARPRTTSSRLDEGPGRRHLRHLRHRRQRLHQRRPALDLSATQGPTGTAPLDPRHPRRPRDRRARSSTRCRRRCRSTRRGRRPAPATGTPRRSRRWIKPEQHHAPVPQARRRRDAPDLRRRAARAVAALRPLLHRRVGQRDEPGHVRAQLQHPRRRAAVALRRRLAAHRR